MKKMRKLVPAFAMLLISAVMMSTASYAWFSMNKTVTAQGMEVTAKSDSSSLVIIAGKDQTISATETNTTATAAVDATIFPITPSVTALTAANIETNSSWQYAYSNAENTSAKDGYYITLADNKTLLGDGNYVIKQTFTVGLQNSTDGVTTASNLKLKTVTLGSAVAGITVVVVCGNNITGEHAAGVTDGNEVLAQTITKGTPVNVDVYIFIDGDNENVTTANLRAGTLTGTIALNFSVD